MLSALHMVWKALEWFGRAFSSLWDLGSGFLGMLPKSAWGGEPSRTGSADGLTIPVCDGVKALQVPGVQGGVLSCRMSM